MRGRCSSTIRLASALVKRQSITPHDAGCLELIEPRLEAMGFGIERFDNGPVSNMFATLGDGKPTLCLLGHTDVVPPGMLEAWKTDPFEPVLKDDMLYGRGACDMKGSVAAMVTAMERYIKGSKKPCGTLMFALTSEEETGSFNGANFLVNELKRLGRLPIDYCLVGEPSSIKVLGDNMRVGRRGSLVAHVKVFGQQGHTAYGVENPVHAFTPVLHSLVNEVWDKGNESFAPTSFQVSKFVAGELDGADNTTPGVMEFVCNWRFITPEHTMDSLKEHLENLLRKLIRKTDFIDYSVSYTEHAEPFLTSKGSPLIQNVKEAIKQRTGVEVNPDTGGGSSDGRFFAAVGSDVVEFGPINSTIHKVNECVSTKDLDALSDIYELCITKILGSNKEE
eukprot:Nk52_evm52s217 gene=Nk52_evmTU52s217